jgi:thiosulfate dehydrogenase [quinone] large subunit
MDTFSSQRGVKAAPISSSQERDIAMAPLQIGESGMLILAFVRIFIGYLWFQQLFWKLPPTYSGLNRYVVREVQGTFLPGYGSFIQHVFLPNFLLLGTFTFLAEFVVAICLLFGIFTRFGAMLSVILALQLYVGLSNTEWYWTYGMLVLLGVMLVPLPVGRRLGIDQWLAPRLQAAAGTNRLARICSWFV